MAFIGDFFGVAAMLTPQEKAKLVEELIHGLDETESDPKLLEEIENDLRVHGTLSEESLNRPFNI